MSILSLSLLLAVILPVPNSSQLTATTIVSGQPIVGSTVGEPILKPDGADKCIVDIETSGVLYVIVGTGGTLTATTCTDSSNFDTQLAIYSGSSAPETGDPSSLSCINGDNDDGSCSPTSRSTVSVTTSANTFYFILVTGFSTNTGTYGLSASLDSGAATFVDVGNGASSSVQGSTVSTSILEPDGTDSCGTSITANGMLYVVIGNGGTLTASTCSASTDSNYDTKISIYSSSGLGDYTCITGNDDQNSCFYSQYHSSVSTGTTDGTYYYVLVHGWTGTVRTDTGNFDLTLTLSKVPTSSPTPVPTDVPTNAPTDEPTDMPTKLPTETPTNEPSAAPTLAPTLSPTLSPTLNPTVAPSLSPTLTPTLNPTLSPTSAPTAVPTIVPTIVPSGAPSIAPSMAPTAAPSVTPTSTPTVGPIAAPTEAPTSVPTVPSNDESTLAPVEIVAETTRPADESEGEGGTVSQPDDSQDHGLLGNLDFEIGSNMFYVAIIVAAGVLCCCLALFVFCACRHKQSRQQLERRRSSRKSRTSHNSRSSRTGTSRLSRMTRMSRKSTQTQDKKNLQLTQLKMNSNSVPNLATMRVMSVTPTASAADHLDHPDADIADPDTGLFGNFDTAGGPAGTGATGGTGGTAGAAGEDMDESEEDVYDAYDEPDDGLGGITMESDNMVAQGIITQDGIVGSLPPAPQVSSHVMHATAGPDGEDARPQSLQSSTQNLQNVQNMNNFDEEGGILNMAGLPPVPQIAEHDSESGSNEMFENDIAPDAFETPMTPKSGMEKFPGGGAAAGAGAGAVEMEGLSIARSASGSGSGRSASVAVGRTYERWDEKQVVLWVTTQLKNNGLSDIVIEVFVKEFATKRISGTILKQCKMHPKWVDNLISQFSQQNQAIGIWTVIKSAINSVE